MGCLACCSTELGEDQYYPLRQNDFEIKFTNSEFESFLDFKDRFKISRTLGNGGQAEVHQAHDTVTGNEVAIKVFKKRKMDIVDLHAAYLEHSVMQ